MSDAILSVSGLSKRYPVARTVGGRVTSWLSAVSDVSFDVATGSTLAVVGESGSGKSTLARLLVRLERPDEGTIRFRGLDVWDAPARSSSPLTRSMQIVFQDPQASLNPRMRIESVIRDGFYGLGLSRREQRERAGELLELVGLSPAMLRNYPHQLSGGQRQRIGIARALACDPELLIADEPVSSLDGSVQGQLLNLLKGIQAERALTMVFITHDLGVARYMADQVVVMHLGKVVESTGSQELFARPTHPYTQALLSSVPRFGRGGEPRRILVGEPFSPIDPPAVCRFAPRCFRRIQRCTEEEPQLAPGPSPTHPVACFNWTTSSDRGHAA
jgi:oligopeptide transport system ATP-binding protein